MCPEIPAIWYKKQPELRATTKEQQAERFKLQTSKNTKTTQNTPNRKHKIKKQQDKRYQQKLQNK